MLGAQCPASRPPLDLLDRRRGYALRDAYLPGPASALALAAAGARVVVYYGPNAREANAVVDGIRKRGGHADAVGADLAAPNGPHKLAAEVRRIIGDGLDLLVANVGMGKEATTIEETTVEDFDSLFAINIRAPFFLVQQLLPVLGAGGSVILLSSLAAHAAVGTLSAYAATKGAIDSLVKHFALALGERGGQAGRGRSRTTPPAA